MWLPETKKQIKTLLSSGSQEIKKNYDSNPFRYWLMSFVITLAVLLKTTWLNNQNDWLFFLITSLLITLAFKINLTWIIMAGIVMTAVNMLVALWKPGSEFIPETSNYIFILLVHCAMIMIYQLKNEKKQTP